MLVDVDAAGHARGFFRGVETGFAIWGHCTFKGVSVGGFLKFSNQGLKCKASDHSSLALIVMKHL